MVERKRLLALVHPVGRDDVIANRLVAVQSADTGWSDVRLPGEGLSVLTGDRFAA